MRTPASGTPAVASMVVVAVVAAAAGWGAGVGWNDMAGSSGSGSVSDGSPRADGAADARPAPEKSIGFYVGRELTADGATLLGGFGHEPSSHWIDIVPAQQFFNLLDEEGLPCGSYVLQRSQHRMTILQGLGQPLLCRVKSPAREGAGPTRQMRAGIIGTGRLGHAACDRCAKTEHQHKCEAEHIQRHDFLLLWIVVNGCDCHVPCHC
jgi:hypothetical protein